MKHFILVLLVSISTTISSQNTAERTKHFNLENKLAIQGFDPVAYFTQSKGVKGLSKFSASYQGIIYNFATEENKNLFLKNPTKYEPQYGGWCAFAMGDYGEKVEVDPKTFKIVNGKLYLFYNAYFTNTLNSWNKDEANLKLKADKNWNSIIIK